MNTCCRGADISGGGMYLAWVTVWITWEVALKGLLSAQWENPFCYFPKLLTSCWNCLYALAARSSLPPIPSKDVTIC